jgi:SAM-dependent methyltransferase
MNRIHYLQNLLPGKLALGLEIAPAHNPVCPKAEGWNIKTVDCVSTDELITYMSNNPGNDLSKIEAVDIVWNSGALHEAIDSSLHGKFDYIVASHVFEHVPDLIGTLNSCDRLLKPGGILLLALPDRRYMFDFVRPFTTTADAIEAFEEKRGRHSIRNAFLLYFYSVLVNHEAVWERAILPTKFQLNFLQAAAEFALYPGRVATKYVDMHAWVWTPASFKLTILELLLLDYTQFEINRFLQPLNSEFYAVLTRANLSNDKRRVLEDQRFDLASQSILEYSNSSAIPQVTSMPLATIASEATDTNMTISSAENLRHGSGAHLYGMRVHAQKTFNHLCDVFSVALGLK